MKEIFKSLVIHSVVFVFMGASSVLLANTPSESPLPYVEHLPSYLAQNEKPSLSAPADSTPPSSTEPSRSVDKRSGSWTFQWGYNRDAYTQSDLNFRGPGYRFTMRDVVAKDKPEPLSSVYVNPNLFDIPQFNWKVSRYFTDHIRISFGHDHMKYVMTPNQQSSIYGYIDPLAIQKAHLQPARDQLPLIYLFPNGLQRQAGFHTGEAFAITPDFLKFEHTDGLNFLFADIGVTYPFWVSDDGESAISLDSSIGGGPVVCRSDIRVFGDGRNNRYNVCGYGVAAYVAVRLDIQKWLYIDLGAKAGYIDLPAILTTGRSKDKASQNFGFLEKLIYLGTTL